MSSIETKPTVSIGLPVYNGAKHIRRAIESVLEQDFEDFELIIVDNASTDDTVQICNEYVERDARVTLVRNEANLGAAPNFNKSFHLSSGKYFKWLAYDDWVEPSYLRKCVEVLDTQPEVSLCQAQTSLYSEDGEFLGYYEDTLDGMNEEPRKRFMSTLHEVDMVFQVFGLMRSELLESTMQMGAYQGADHTVVAEMALLGKIYMLPEYLNANRNTTSARKGRDHRSWWNASTTKRRRPIYSILAWYHLKAIKRSGLSRLQKLILTTQTSCHFLTSHRLAVIREAKSTTAMLLPFR